MSIGLEEGRADGFSSDRLRKVVSRIDSIPTLPAVVSRIMAAMEDPSTSASDVQKIVSTDQAIAAKILKVVNSSFYGFPRRIGSINEAVVILGFNTIRNLAITCSLFHCFRGRRWEGFDHQLFWNHSIAVALLSRFLSKKLSPRVDGEEVFVMGLLHDIGKVLIEQFHPDGFQDILARIHKEGLSFLEAEMAEIGVNHGEVGEWLALKWNLPVRLAEVVGNHHNPSAARESAHLAAIVHMADAFCHRHGLNHVGEAMSVPISKRAIELLKLSGDVFAGLDTEIEAELERAEEFFNVYEKSTV